MGIARFTRYCKVPSDGDFKGCPLTPIPEKKEKKNSSAAKLATAEQEKHYII